MSTRSIKAGPAGGYWRIAVVEDHLLQRSRTEEVINSQQGLRSVFSCDTLPEFMQWLETTTALTRPHLLILDLCVDRGPSVEPATVRKLVNSGMRVLALSAMASPPLVREVVRAGIGGIVGKRDSEADIIAATWTVLGREEWLTSELAGVIAGDSSRPRLSDQEERALVLYASGLTLEAVAKSLGVKRDTAKTYIDRVKEKYSALGRPARSKVELSHIAVTDGYIDPTSVGSPNG